MRFYQNLNFDTVTSILNNPKILFLHDQEKFNDPSEFHWSLRVEDLHPNFLKIISQTNLEIDLVEVFKTNPNNKSWNVHIDVVESKILYDLPKLNWVYFNNESVMVWYQNKIYKHKELKKTATGTEYLDFPLDEVEEIDRTVIDKIAIVQAGVPHTVINKSNKSRYCVSLIFKKDKKFISFNELVEEFKQYV